MNSYLLGGVRVTLIGSQLKPCLVGLVFLGVAWLLSGCGDRPEAGGDSTFSILAFGDETITGPMWDSGHQHLVFSTLATLDAQGGLVPSLAESWESSEDGRVWTVLLRRDVRWHDGVPFTARDVEFTLNLLAHPELAWGEVPGAYTVTVIDDWTYRIEFHSRTNHSLFPISAWRVFYPKHLLEDLDPKDFATWDFWKEPVGTGPFRYVRHVPSTMVEFQANPDYFEGEPNIGRVIVKFGGHPITELMAGNVDAIGVNGLEAVAVRTLPDFKVYHSVNPENLNGILWNQRRPMFREPAVRQALTLAISREELQKVQDHPDGTPIFDVLVTEEMFRKGEFPDPLPYDPEQAEKILGEFGWSDVNRDGIRERNGTPFHFTVVTGPMQEGLAVLIQENLARVGVRMDIQTLNRGATRNKIRSRDFDAAIQSVRTRNYMEYFGEESLIGVADDRISAAFQSITRAVTRFEVEGAFRDLVPLFQEQMPVTFLSPFVSFRAVHRRIRGLSSSGSWSLGRIEELWIEEDWEEGGTAEGVGGR